MNGTNRTLFGVAPALASVNEIRSVTTLDEFSALITSGGMFSLKEAFVCEAVTTNPDNGTQTVLAIGPQTRELREDEKNDRELYMYLMQVT